MTVKRGSEWIRKARVYLLDMKHIDWEREEFDAVKLVRNMMDNHANVLRFSAYDTDGYAYFKSNIAPRNPAMKNRDFFQEALDECKKHGIKLAAYNHLDLSIKGAETHPDCKALNINDKHIYYPTSGFYRMCVLVSPYRDFLLSVIRELVENYDIDCLYMDGPSPYEFSNVCYCKYCQDLFRKEHGVELPRSKTDEAWEDFTRWRSSKYIAFYKGIIKIVESTKPNLPIVSNTPRTDVLPFLDGILLETDGAPYHKIGLYYKYGLAVRKPVWAHLRLGITYMDVPTCDLDWKLKGAQILASGCNLAIYNAHAMYMRFSPEKQKIIAKYFKFAMDNEKYLSDVSPTPFLAIASSSDRPFGTASYMGLARALVQSHIPFTPILGRDLDKEWLKEFKVLCLPNVRELSDAQIQSVKEFVINGGGLVATYETSLRNEQGYRRENFGLAQVFHCQFQGYSQPGSQYIEVIQETPIIAGLRQGTLIPATTDKSLYVHKMNGSIELGCLLSPTAVFFGAPGLRTCYPGILCSTFGNGRVVYIPAPIDETYFERDRLEIRLLIEGCISWVSHGRLPVKLIAPSSVEVSIFEKPNLTLLHIVNYTTDILDEKSFPTHLTQLNNLKVEVLKQHGKTVKEVSLLSTEEKLKSTVKDDYVVFIIPHIEEYAPVAIEYE